jgi:hypothetical protein
MLSYEESEIQGKVSENLRMIGVQKVKYTKKY